MLANQTQPRGKSLIYHNQRAFLPVMQDGFNVRRGTKGTASEENKEEKPHGHRHRRRRKHLAESNTHFKKKKKKKTLKLTQNKKLSTKTSLVLQGPRTRLPGQGTRAQAPGWGDPPRPRAAKKPEILSPPLQALKPACPRAWTLHRGGHPRDRPPLAAARESPGTAVRAQHSQK